jgi:hypothetical protein
MNSENIEIEDLEYFYRYVRMYSYCNAELSIDPDLQEDKEILLDQSLRESTHLLYTDDLEEIMPLLDIVEYVTPYLKKDDEEQYFISHADITSLISQISFKICINLFEDLEKNGYAQLAWDSSANDFVYIWKNKC